MNILVTGGAGYIGSHVVKQLGELTNSNIIVVDNFSTGFKENVLYGKVIDCDLSNLELLESIFKNENIDIVIHFAGSIVVSESIIEPLKYYINNTNNTINLINLAVKYKIKKFIFSSTAAVYGEISNTPIIEDNSLLPINPYGWSKLMSERILIDTAKANDFFDYIILRYFNVAGASLDNKIGQSFPISTHLIKIASEVAIGKRDKMFIFGNDYNTFDGTCIRDYIHVEDLASAHLIAVEYDGSDIFNCGYGKGYSVREVIDVMKSVSGVDFEVELTNRREGDSAILISDNSKILTFTKWRPKYNDLRLICETALEWEKKLNQFKNN